MEMNHIRPRSFLSLITALFFLCDPGRAEDQTSPHVEKQMTDVEFRKAVNDFRSTVDRWPAGIAFLQKLREKTTDKNRLYLIDCAIAEFTLNPSQAFKDGFLDKPREQLAEIARTYPDKKWDTYYVYLVLKIRGSQLIPPEELHAFEPYAKEIQQNLDKLTESPDILPDGKFFVETMLKDALARCADLGILNVVPDKLYTREEIISILHKIVVNGDVSLRERILENLAILRKSAMDDEIKYLVDYTDAKVTLFSCREPRDVEQEKIEEAKAKLKEIERNYPDRLQEGTYILLKLEVYGDPYAEEDYKIAMQVARDVLGNWRNGIQIHDILQENLRQCILLNCSSHIEADIRRALIEKQRKPLAEYKLSDVNLKLEVYKQLINELKNLKAPEDLIQFQKSHLDNEEARARGIELPRRPWSWPAIKPEDLPPHKPVNKPSIAEKVNEKRNAPANQNPIVGSTKKTTDYVLPLLVSAFLLGVVSLAIRWVLKLKGRT